MKSNTKIQEAAKNFAQRWQNRGYEKGESHSFWLDLLQNVLGIEKPGEIISFEKQVKLANTSFIDAYIKTTRVLIEQKSRNIDLHKAIKQSDGSVLTPFAQAKRYASELPLSKHPRWVVTCNFQSFLVYDMESPQNEPEEILLKDLEREHFRLRFLVDDGKIYLQRELELSIKAGELVGQIYDALLEQYGTDVDDKDLHTLNVLCVRLVFCLYVEDAGIFSNNQFYDYLSQYKPEQMRSALLALFNVLDTRVAERNRFIEENLNAFPYVNGSLFSQRERAEIPTITDKIANILLQKASLGFDWSEISPTIFGAVFESTLNPATRRGGGMHYTSIENIHKVIDPLFLNELRTEFEDIKQERYERNRFAKLDKFQTKLASLNFLDPACGSGNFLTESYLSLRRLENEVIDQRMRGQKFLAFESHSPIRVSIGQFYGIEINDFAVTVAQTAMWIAESQMMHETERIVKFDLDYLPLKSFDNIHFGNALRMDWEDVIAKENLHYIMGNPPFVGKSYQTDEQKIDMRITFDGVKNYGNLDYVAAWYKKTADYIYESEISAAFVSTSSICQGVAVPPLWRNLLSLGIKIIFAYPAFRWSSDSLGEAAVYCVIIGFAYFTRSKYTLFTENKSIEVSNINPYLLNAANIIVDDRHSPLCDVPNMLVGSFPTDGGNLVILENEYEEFIKKEPQALKYIKLYIGPDEFIKNKKRYCLWLQACTPSELKGMPNVMKRVEKVREFRLNSMKKQTQKRADIPMLFAENRQPDSDYILLPRTSTSNRKYLPIGFLPSSVIAGDTIVLPDATLYHFSILTSFVHMAWMRVVCGRLGMAYRYSNTIVYNNFPWPKVSDAQKKRIEETGKGILEARDLYPDSSLADLYDDLLMPRELRAAHERNDRAVMEGYGFDWQTMNESECVEELFKMYETLVGE